MFKYVAWLHECMEIVDWEFIAAIQKPGLFIFPLT